MRLWESAQSGMPGRAAHPRTIVRRRVAGRRPFLQPQRGFLDAARRGGLAGRSRLPQTSRSAPLQTIAGPVTRAHSLIRLRRQAHSLIRVGSSPPRRAAPPL